jgi:Putative prokaryotic signal transducing protein
MPHCPKCLIEYVDGTEECEDCGTVLLPGPVPEEEIANRELPSLKDANLVTLHTFSGPTALLDADVARNLLASQGITSLVAGETSVEMLPVLDCPLLVRAEDAEKAARVLASFLDTSAAGSVAPEED